MKRHFLRFPFISILFVALMYNCSKDSTDNCVYSEAVKNGFQCETLENTINTLTQSTELLSLVISRDNKVILEEYFNDFGRDSVHDVRSVTKSFLSLLVGMAFDKGHFSSLDETVDDYLPDSLLTNADQEVKEITIRQLITMTPGTPWQELNGSSEFPDFVLSGNMLQYALNKPVIYNNDHFEYSDGAAHIMSVILKYATGQSTWNFAETNLFQPLDFGGDYFWYVDLQGFYVGGVGLVIRPIDMIKIGNLVLQNGSYNGQQIVSSDWIEESTAPYINTNQIVPFETVMDTFGGNLLPDKLTLLWQWDMVASLFLLFLKRIR